MTVPSAPLAPSDDIPRIERRIRRWTLFFIAALWLSGLTAVPLEAGARLMADVTSGWGMPWAGWSARVCREITDAATHAPLLFYGTDWLAFAHIVIGMAFIGPLRDPVRNRWVIEWALWACALVVLVAFAWAPVRGIPFFWRCIDASFGVIGAVPLWSVLRDIRSLEKLRPA